MLNKSSAPIPPGVELLRVLEGHEENVFGLSFDATGKTLVSGSGDKTLKVWEVDSGKLLQTISAETRVFSVAVDPAGRYVAHGSHDQYARVRDLTDGTLIGKLPGHNHWVWSVSYSADGGMLGTAGADRHLRVWKAPSGPLLHTFEAHTDWLRCVAFDRDGKVVASGGDDGTLRVWEVKSGNLLYAITEAAGGTTWILSIAFHPKEEILATCHGHNIQVHNSKDGKLLRRLEGHTDKVDALVFSPDGHLLASRCTDHSVRLWNCETWETVAIIPTLSPDSLLPAIAFHPTLPILATVSSDPGSQGERARLIHLWQLDLTSLLGQRTETAVHYVNAKVVLVGDTGVGKSGLSLVLNGQPFEATDSTPGRHVWMFDSREVPVNRARTQTRETLLWDLAGQPGYRIIHQLHLKEVAVALVVFDARSETDPLAGVRHWERALRLAHQREGAKSIPMRKFLVSARSDRGVVSVSKERLQAFCKDFGFDGYFETSAKAGWQIKELRQAIEQAIPWDDLPVVTSERLFARIKAFLLQVKESGRLLAPATQLYDDFGRDNAEMAQFETCIGRLENRDLIRRLTFGGYVLLQPELLDAYASAIVNAAKNEPDGLGSIAEDAALAGQFHVPDEQKVTDRGQEQVLLHATVEELVRHDLALRENAEDGRYLVFPSQFNRDYAAAPEPEGTTLAMTFEGPVQSIYSTLAVRLSHSGVFETGRTTMWRNAALFTARAGGRCGIFVKEFTEEAHGQVLLFFEPAASVETRFHFEQYVYSHLSRRALEGSVDLIRYFVCTNCMTPVPDRYVKMLRDKHQHAFQCPCGAAVSLIEPKKQLAAQYPSQVEAMDRSADHQRDFDAMVVSASGETHTKNFIDWAGGERAMLAIVFTDVVGSTALENKIGGERMNDVRRAHFAQSRRLLDQHNGREIKTIGDSFMVAFHRVDEALDFAMILRAQPGDPNIQVRAGIHVGAMQVEENDVFGGTVNFAARVVGAIKGSKIWVSERAHDDIHSLRAKRHTALKWKRHQNITMKGFPGTFTLWSLVG